MKWSVKSRRSALLPCMFGLALAAAAGADPARALDYPVRPVHLVAGYPAGGTVDIVARLMGQYLGERLGQAGLLVGLVQHQANKDHLGRLVARVDGQGLTGKVLKWPERDEIDAPVQEQLIVELYSK